MYVFVCYYDVPCPFESQPVEPQAIVVNIVAHKLKMHFLFYAKFECLPVVGFCVAKKKWDHINYTLILTKQYIMESKS